MSISLPGRAPDFSIQWPADGAYGVDDPLTMGLGVELFVELNSGGADTYVIGTDSFGRYFTTGGARTDFSALVLSERDDPVDAAFARFRANTEEPAIGSVPTAFAAFGHRLSPASNITKQTFPVAAPPVHRSEVYANGERAIAPGDVPSTHYREVRAHVSADSLSAEWLDPTIGPGSGASEVLPFPRPEVLRWNEPWSFRVTANAKIYGFDLWNELDRAASGMWSTRQRQNPAGNAGGWPLRHRQNAGATGAWPLRQRQNGM